MEEKELRSILSSNIKMGRMKASLSQLAFAGKIGISANYLSNIERCKAWVSPPTIVKIANALNIEPYELFKVDKITYGGDVDKLQLYVEENRKAVLNLLGEMRE